MSRHVVLVHRYFEPDTPPYAAILGAVARHLGSQGCRVTVLSCQPSYNRSVVSRAPARESWAPGVEVVRWPVLDDRSSSGLKLVNLAWFCLRLLTEIPRTKNVDVVMAASTPPIVVAGLVSVLARLKGARFVYHKQDIYPEVTVGLGSRLGRVAGIMRAIDARTDRRANRVVVLSRDMAQTTAERGVSRDVISVINNFDPWQMSGADDVDALDRGADDRLHMVFAGNLGRFQGLESVFEALVELRDEPLVFHFFGQGALSEHLEALVDGKRLENVRIHGYCPPGEVAEFLRFRADLGIVSLAPGVIRAAYPSKTLSYLRQGTPVLALVEGDSELGRIVIDENIGQQSEPGDTRGLVTVLRRLARDRDVLEGAPQRARKLYADEFSQSRRLAQWDRLFEELAP